MSFLRLSFVFCLLLFIGTSSLARADMTPDEQQQRTKVVEGYLRQRLAEFETKVAASSPSVDSPDLANAALAYIILGEGDDKGVAKAEAALELIFSAQNMKAGSPGFGDCPWFVNNPKARDENSIEFTCHALGPLFLTYGDRFPKDFLDKAVPHLKAALVAVSNHQVNVDYTNIALMKVANLILLGEYVNDPASIAKGKARLDDWIAYTRTNGITEFDSGTYGQVQFCDLYSLYHNVRDSEIKAKTKVILDYLWTVLAVNFYPGSQSLSGPNSRAHDFMRFDSDLAQIYYLNGLPAKISNEFSPLNDQVQIWVTAIWNDYTPPPEAMDLANLPTRLIHEHYGPLPGEDRTNYITPDFTIGSSSRYYGLQDRQVVASLASTKDLPSISIIPDSIDSPFGKVWKLVDKSNHKKIFHLEYASSAVQFHSQVLALLDLSPGLAKSPVSSVATNVILPLQADEFVVDGAPVNWSSGNVPLTADSVIGIREGNGAVAVRLFTAEAAPGSTTTFCLKNDGKEWGAARLVAYQYQGAETRLNVPSLCSGVLLLAARCTTEDEFQNFLKQAKAWSVVESKEGGLWKVTATGGAAPTTLQASLDIAKHETGPRLVNGQPVVSPIFTINDVDWAGKIWQQLPATTSTP